MQNANNVGHFIWFLKGYNWDQICFNIIAKTELPFNLYEKKNTILFALRMQRKTRKTNEIDQRHTFRVEKSAAHKNHQPKLPSTSDSLMNNEGFFCFVEPENYFLSFFFVEFCFRLGFRLLHFEWYN